MVNEPPGDILRLHHPVGFEFNGWGRLDNKRLVFCGCSIGEPEGLSS